ncbi:MAG TPA: divalent-cation tolerance protein CutA [bacterium]
MAQCYVVFVTTPNRRVSEAMSKGLVKSKLAACVNVVPSLRSRYWWKGKVATAKEELLLIKTNQTRLPKLIQWVKTHHPYAVCEVVALSIASGNKPYLNWIHQSLR